ncbi:hypothetical protein HJ526_04630 [Donghicola sp. C2-DW-16]|uniref:Transposase n=1 Tax=Donghicola mangrovi TaxID=2729614 RepID=A0ABX2PB49_9RHOB|nr:hypothetical protein [Donghicola mangrovi]NVO26696.1 hypothetical protein [Donghicola mangrovi]
MQNTTEARLTQLLDACQRLPFLIDSLEKLLEVREESTLNERLLEMITTVSQISEQIGQVPKMLEPVMGLEPRLAQLEDQMSQMIGFQKDLNAFLSSVPGEEVEDC